MTLPTLRYRWSRDEFVRAYEAGAFEHRVELVDTIGDRVDVWAADDVLLVVEVSDETVMHDLNVKTRIYGQAGFPVCWVVTRDLIYEHTEPTSHGYRLRAEYQRGDRIPVRYAEADLDVSDILGA